MSHPQRSHHNGAKGQNNPGLEERRRREVEDGIGQDDHVRPGDEGDVSRDGAAKLVAERPGGLHEALEALHAVLIDVWLLGT